MSPDPQPFDDTAGAPRDHPAGPQVGAGPARAGSSFAARLLTTLYALAITPLATGLLAYGGSGWLRIYSTRGYLGDSTTDLLLGPAGLQILGGAGLGILLLASVVATGIVSSAGLLVAGALGLLSLVLSAVPSLLIAVYQGLLSFVPLESVDGFAYGLPLVLHTLMGGLGAALVITRRRPDPHLAASLVGLLVVPALLLLGASLQLGGIGNGVLRAMRTFDTRISVVTIALIAGGCLLLWLGAAASRWSPYALLVPALVLLAAVVPFLVPAAPLPPGIWSSPTAASAASFLLIGGGVAAAVILLVQTAVQAVVRRRARLSGSAASRHARRPPAPRAPRAR